ncbi:SET domain-containing protein [Delitschia confertaspora ATCC 74209]|uniref:SET domain-containing protein n=1 Tax=Delitschia confertaspora ATCC 74209 TaxID=1513339 RepID=A0A9P4MQS6_9PLEO|nr:SET domain-containing protein [Delitschia confertaspora ATCC 74209]
MMLYILLSILIFPCTAETTSYLSAEVAILKDQCWHDQTPFDVYLQCWHNGTFEPVYMIKDERSLKRSCYIRSLESQFHPWSYKPICTETIEVLGDKLCVYTNKSFAFGRGISLFTTPKVAEEFVRLPASQNFTVLTDNSINEYSSRWYTSSLPGRGIGMLAKDRLQHGDRITAYTPVLLAYLEQELPTMEREKYLRVAVNQLPIWTREEFLQLATVYGDERIRVQDIIKANTFELYVGDQNHLAVFPETSRFNHACAPNAQYYLDSELLTHFVHATRPIASDEEIIIAYTSPLSPTSERQKHLSEAFHFTCTCPRCAHSTSSDAVLAQIHSMQSTLNDWSPTSTASPELAETILALYRKEGLEGFLDIPYGFAALTYNAVGDMWNATKYAQLAVEAIFMKDGSWTQNMGIWREMLENPRKHWSWRRRAE